MGRYSEQWDWLECDWCRMRGGWERRPCLLRACQPAATMRAKREACEAVRMENAAKRNKTLPKVDRRAMMAAAAAAAAAGSNVGPGSNSSIRADTEVLIVGGASTLDGVETDTATDKLEASTPPTGSRSTSKSKQHEAEVKKASQKRQTKACTSLKSVIDEGISLAFDDDDNVARIHAANRKAWPRGQVPIAADATIEDREIAELVRRGLIGPEGVGVNHDDSGDDVLQYAVRFVMEKKKRRNRQRRGAQVGEGGPLDAESESDWLYLDDGSELSFVYVD